MTKSDSALNIFYLKMEILARKMHTQYWSSMFQKT